VDANRWGIDDVCGHAVITLLMVAIGFAAMLGLAAIIVWNDTRRCRHPQPPELDRPMIRDYPEVARRLRAVADMVEQPDFTGGVPKSEYRSGYALQMAIDGAWTADLGVVIHDSEMRRYLERVEDEHA
jgi:hypothetical protein